MEFRDFHIESVAKFREVHLQFGRGLNLLYGPNETGKSTLLSLLTDFLFGGMPENRDWYGSDSRLWADMIHEDETHPIRRKRYRGQLVAVDSQDKPTEADWLQDVIGLDRDRFMQLYGFNHERLRTGGKSLVEHGGDAAVSLFEAGGGTVFVQQILDGYRNRLQTLFHPGLRSNASAELNRYLREYMAARERERSVLLRPATWVAADREVQVLSRRVQELQRMIQDKMTERQKLQRISRNHPMVMEYQTTLEAFLGIDSSNDIPESEEAVILEQIEACRASQFGLTKERELLHAEQTRLHTITSDEAILAFEPELESLRDSFALYQSTRDEILRLGDTRLSLEREIHQRTSSLMPVSQQSVWSQVASDDVLEAELAPTSEDRTVSFALPIIRDADKIALRHLYRDYQDLDRNRELLDRDTKSCAFELGQLRDRIDSYPALVEVAPLKHHIQTWREKGISAVRTAEAQSRFRTKQVELERHYESQTLWRGPVEEVLSLPVPLLQTLQTYADEFRILREQQQKCAQSLAQLKDSYLRHESARKALDLAGHVPSEADLLEARLHRDNGWKHIRDKLVFPAISTPDQVSYADGYASLEDAYEGAVTKVDEMSDRLRREADRVARRAELVAEMLREGVEIERLEAEQSQLEASFKQLYNNYEAEWEASGIKPKSPLEMIAWMQQWLQPMRQSWEEMQRLEQEAKKLQLDLDAAMDELAWWARPLAIDLPADYDGALKVVESTIASFEEIARNHQLLSDEITKLESKRKTILSEQQALHQALDVCIASYGKIAAAYPFLPENPLLCEETLQQYESLKTLMDERDKVEQTRMGKEAIVEAFHQKLSRIVNALREDMVDKVDEDISAAYYQLRKRLEEAQAKRDDKAKQQSIVAAQMKRVEMLEGELHAIDAFLNGWQSRFSNCDEDTLVSHIEKQRRWRELDTLRRGLEHRLLASGDGYSLEELLEEVATCASVDQLGMQISECSSEVSSLQETLSDVQVAFGEARQRYLQMDGAADDAASARQDAMMLSAKIKANFTEAVRLQTRLMVLEKALTLYRDENQHGVLERAGENLRRLTDNRYLKLDLDDDPIAPKLLAIHRDGHARTFSELSDGTVDQLHLALRLAFIETQSMDGVRLPLIMDDVLVHFDDRRASATLEVLNELSQTTQIFYFTHHHHLMDRVATQAQLGQFVVHQLEDHIHYR